MGRLYTVVFNAVAVTAQQDLFEVLADSVATLMLHSLELSQSTEVGDAQEEGLNILLKSGQTTTGSGGTTPTAVPILLGDAAFGGTCKVNNTTKATAGTIVTRNAWNWNIRGEFVKIWTPETRPIFRAGTRMTIELATTPADSITMSGTLTFESIG